MLIIYTGCGKGKTSAMLGGVLRALGAKKRVLFTQFLKGQKTSEINALSNIKMIYPNLTIKQFGFNEFLNQTNKDMYINETKNGFEYILSKKQEFDYIFLDEFNLLNSCKIISEGNMKEFLLKINSEDKIIFTSGRYAPQNIIELADIVSDIKEIKHHYNKNVKAIKGLDF